MLQRSLLLLPQVLIKASAFSLCGVQKEHAEKFKVCCAGCFTGPKWFVAGEGLLGAVGSLKECKLLKSLPAMWHGDFGKLAWLVEVS